MSSEHQVSPTGATMAERAEQAMKEPEGVPYIVTGIFRDGRRFADEYASPTGWEGAEAAALEEHPTLEVAAVLKVESGKVRVCDVERV